jgi:outer membrane protein assembly factor BamB
MANSDQASNTRPSWLRRWFAWLIVLVGVLAVAGLQGWPGDAWVVASRNFSSLAVAAVCGLLVFFWGVFFSSRRKWFVIVGILAALLCVASIREFRFTGDMAPILTFRWERNHDQELEKHRLQQGMADAIPVIAGEASFAEYRGARRDGVVRIGNVLRNSHYSPPRLVWRQPCGGGYAQLSVAGNVAVTIEQRRDQEVVVCYDTTTGKERWTHAYPAHFKETLGGDGPRATPAIADGRVVALGAAGMLSCLDLALGKLYWSVNILDGNDNVRWGMSGSPLVHANLVIVNPGAQKAAFAGKALVAYDRENGAVRWAAGDKPAGYASPMFTVLAGQPQIVIFDGDGVAGHEPETGKELWRYPWTTQYGINVAQPLIVDDRVFVSSGYGVGCAMLRVARTDGKWTVDTLWRNTNMRCKFTSPVLHSGHIYGLDEGFLACLDVETGDQKWRDGRYGHGQILLVDGMLYVLSEKGKLVLVSLDPEKHNERGAVQAVTGKTWNPFAFADNRVYVRNSQEMACFEFAGEIQPFAPR